MSRVRVDQEGINQRQVVIGYWETSIRNWEMVIASREHPTFKMITDKIEVVKKSAEASILGLAMKPEDPERDRQAYLHMGGQLKVVSTILGDFKNAEANIDKAREKIADLKREIEQAKTTGIIEETAARVR